MMKIFFIFLIIGVFLWFKEKTKQHESRAVDEEERHNNVSPLSNSEIENQYFNMKTDIYLKKKYPTMISWEWARGSKNALHYTNPSNGVNLVHRDGFTEHILVRTREIWNNNKTVMPTETENTSFVSEDNMPHTVPIDAESKVIEYLKENALKIEDTVKAAMEKGCGFFTNFEVSKEIATEEFMKKLAQELEKNTEYDVSFKDNVLEINFQDAMM